MSITPFRALRILFLLILLGIAAFYSKSQGLGSRAWTDPLDIAIFPINGEGTEKIDAFLDDLDANDFASIDTFFKRESRYYDVISETPTRTLLGSRVKETPPPASNPNANPVAIVWWSLKLRWRTYRHTPDEHSNHQRIRVFVIYHELAQGKRLQHSLGLNKGLIGVVHAFADVKQNAQNNLVIAHEILHTVGASDKYGNDGAPVYPDGYAEPDSDPLYPQTAAEIMAGRIPISADAYTMAMGLDNCMISDTTARENNWLDSE